MNQLVADASDDILNSEFPILSGNLSMKHNLKQKVAQLITELLRSRLLQGLQNLIALLNQVRS